MGMVNRTCWCGKHFQVRAADVKRGWGKACCKSHAAHAREKLLDRNGYRARKNGQTHAEYYEGEQTFSNAHLFSNEEHNCNK